MPPVGERTSNKTRIIIMRRSDATQQQQNAYTHKQQYQNAENAEKIEFKWIKKRRFHENSQKRINWTQSRHTRQPVNSLALKSLGNGSKQWQQFICSTPVQLSMFKCARDTVVVFFFFFRHFCEFSNALNGVEMEIDSRTSEKRWKWNWRAFVDTIALHPS